MFGRRKRSQEAVEPVVTVPESILLSRQIVEPTPEWLAQLETTNRVKFVRRGDIILASVIRYALDGSGMMPKHMDIVQSRPDLDADVEDAGFLRLDGKDTVESIAVVAFSTIYLRGDHEQRQKTVDVLQAALPDTPISFDDDDLSAIYR